MWLSRDPIAEAGGINLTGFGNADPINNYDPYGLESSILSTHYTRLPFGHSVYMQADGGFGVSVDGSTFALASDVAAPAIEKATPYVRSGAEITGSFVWGVGEFQDVMLIQDANAAPWMRWVAGGSLAVNVVVPVLPNAGGFMRGGSRIANEIVSHSDEVARIAKQGQRITRAGQRITGPLTAVQKKAFRAQARRNWRKGYGQLATQMGNLKIHHRIPLEYSHIFAKANPNRLSNLVGLHVVDHFVTVRVDQFIHV